MKKEQEKRGETQGGVYRGSNSVRGVIFSFEEEEKRALLQRGHLEKGGVGESRTLDHHHHHTFPIVLRAHGELNYFFLERK